jgi:hypothetical protein
MMKNPLLISLAALVPALAAGAQVPVEPVPAAPAPPKRGLRKPAAPRPRAPPRPSGPPGVTPAEQAELRRQQGLLRPADGEASPFLQFADLFRGGEGPRVDLDIDAKTVADAVDEIFTALKDKAEYALEPDVPNDVRITVRAKNVRLSTALDLVADAAGIRWGREIKDGKTVYRLGKKVPPLMTPGRQSILPPNVEEAVRNFRNVVPLEPNGSVNIPFRQLYKFSLEEERSTFNCPHCKGQTTMVRVRQQPKCTKCSRVFQGDWQFCPSDGAKRPASPGEWRHCPLCGKQVDPIRPGTPPVDPAAVPTAPRVATPIGPVRLHFGSSGAPGRTHFSIGHAF